MSFNELIGNKKIKQDLTRILENNTVSHSYMFIGTKGIGKKLFAKEFAKGILCNNKEKRPCEECKSCIEFVNSNNPDYYEINLADDENSIKIDTIRELQKKIQELPIVSNRKVYIINDSEYMTKDAQNCLLKTLEEPPSFVTLILIVSNENMILNTIKSRCLKLYFNGIPNNEIMNYIKQNLNFDAFTPNMLKACEGSIGKAKNIYANANTYLEVDKVFNNIEKHTLIDVISKLEVLYKNKEHINEILEYINTIFIEKARNDFKYIQYIKYIEEAKRDIKQNCNYDMCIDNLLFKIFEGE